MQSMAPPTEPCSKTAILCAGTRAWPGTQHATAAQAHSSSCRVRHSPPSASSQAHVPSDPCASMAGWPLARPAAASISATWADAAACTPWTPRCSSSRSIWRPASRSAPRAAQQPPAPARSPGRCTGRMAQQECRADPLREGGLFSVQGGPLCHDAPRALQLGLLRQRVVAQVDGLCGRLGCVAAPGLTPQPLLQAPRWWPRPPRLGRHLPGCRCQLGTAGVQGGPGPAQPMAHDSPSGTSAGAPGAG